MKQFKALLIKEWQTHKFSFLIPAFVVAGFFILLGIISIYGKIRYGMPVQFQDNGQFDPKDVLWTMHYVMSIVIAWFAMLASITINDNMLNQDYHKKCEIMHHSQPVSLLKMLGAKLTLSVPIMLLQYLLLAVLSSLIVSAVFGFLGFNSWILGLQAVFSPLILVTISMIAATSLFWLFSCIFRKQAVMKVWLTLVVIDLLRLMLSRIWGDSLILSPLSYYFRIITLPLSVIKVSSSDFNFAWDGISTMPNLISLGVSLLMFVAGYFIYKQRELS